MGKELSRPFKYASNAFSTVTEESGRRNVGGDIVNKSTSLVLKCVDSIVPDKFVQHLRSKGFTN